MNANNLSTAKEYAEQIIKILREYGMDDNEITETLAMIDSLVSETVKNELYAELSNEQKIKLESLKTNDFNQEMIIKELGLTSEEIEQINLQKLHQYLTVLPKSLAMLEN